MVSNFIFFVCAIFVLYSNPIYSRPLEEKTTKLDSDGQLVFLQTIWRHGDRTPVVVYPNDPNQESTWPQGLGQLTTEGLQQHVNLGRKLRQLYGGIFSNTYNSKEIYVRSSDVNRTILSAQANMIGFFGDVQENDLSQIGWPKGYVPIPIHTVPEQYDFMRALLHKDCKRFDELTQLISKTPEYLKLAEQNRELIEKMQVITGDHNLSLNQIGLVADTWRIEKKYNRSEMPGFGQELYDLIEPVAFKTNSFKYGLELNPFQGVDLRLESAKMHGGLLLWAMIDNMEQKRDCMEASVMGRSKDAMAHCAWMDELKYYVFSAHDSTMASLFATLGFPKTNYKSDGFPPYAACLAVELRKHHQTQDYYVKLNYITGEDVVDVTSDVEGCSSAECIFEEFTNRSIPYKIEDVKQYCNAALPTLIEN